MAISISTDILWKYSIKTGTAGNQNPQTNQNASLGKYISTTQWAGGSLHDLFDVVTGSENAVSTVAYRAVFLHNNHGSLTFQNVVVWISAETSGGCNIAIGVDPTAAASVSSSSAQAVQVTNETTAPVGVSFSTPTTEGAGLSLGDIGPGQCRAIWFRRTATNSVALNGDGATLAFSGDSAA
jgi:hypothetical protein